MKKTSRRVVKNFALRKELIDKGLVIPDHLVPKWLKSRGFTEAAKAAALRRGLFHV